MRKSSLSSLFILWLSGTMLGQQTITGVVTHSSGEVLIGANVVIKGTALGAVTDHDGRYSLTSLDQNAILIFSYTGFLTKEIKIDHRKVIDVTLEEGVAMDEIVVTALGVSREEKSLGYAVQKLSSEDVTNVKQTNIVNSLAGRISGVQVNSSSGNIGGSARILIRGANSIDSDNQPLFIVDGTPIDNSNFNGYQTERGNYGRDYGNAAQDINPDDIESITVLKGPSASALYGSRASNGVILITTKSGQSRKGIGIEVNSSLTFDRISLLPTYQNEYGGGYKQSFDLDPISGDPVVNYAADESWGPKMDGRLVRQWYSWFEGDPDFGKMTPFLPHPNNVRNFYEKGHTASTNVALSGGNEQATFRASYTNHDQKGLVPNSFLKRNTLAVSAGADLSDKLKISTKINYITSRGRRPSIGWLSTSGSFNEWFQRQVDLDGKMRTVLSPTGAQRSWNIKSPSNFTPAFWDNPYYETNFNHNDDARQRVFGNLSLSYQFNKHLSLTLNARTDFYTDRREDRIGSASLFTAEYKENVLDLKENNYDILLQYQRSITPNISLTLNSGANARKQTFFQNEAITVGGLTVPDWFNITASVERPIITDLYSERRVNSVYGSTSVGWKNMVYIDLSLRNDWSSTLPSQNNSYLYPAITGSLVFSELISNNSIVSFGKIRAGWSQTGKDSDPYRLATVYDSRLPFGSSPAFAVSQSINNPNLKPETTTSWEVGLAMRFLRNRVGLDFTYYQEDARNQIIPLPVAQTSGFSEAVINAGLITNKGMEFSLNATPILSRNFTWNLIFNIARNRNQVVELFQDQTNFQLASWNISLNARVGEPYGTFFGTSWKKNDNGQKLVDENGFWIREPNQVLGNVMPDFTGGLYNEFTYKGISVSALLNFQKGGDIFSLTNRYGSGSGMFAETVGPNDKGVPQRDPVDQGGGMRFEGVHADGTPNTTYIDASVFWNHRKSIFHAFIYDASFLKLKEVRIAYALPQSIIKTWPTQDVSIALVGNNLAILHKNVPHVDPETASGSGNVQGYVNGQLPSSRSIGINLQLKF